VQRYILRRLLQIVPILLLVSIAAFVAMHLIPGGPIAIYGRGGITPEAAAAIRARLGLDDPLFVQYVRWLTAAAQGDFGYSFTTGRPVISEIGDRLGPTVYLMGSTFIVVLILSIALGILQAVRQYSRIDVALTTLSFAGAAMPVFWLGLMLILIDNAIRNPVSGRPFLPIGGMTTPGGSANPLDFASHLVLPMIALALGWVSWYARYVRASMLDVIHQDYIRTARAKGVHERVVVFKHAFKNAAIPLVTVVALDLPYLFAGALFVEIIFAWPGMGQLFYRAAVIRDYPLMLGIIIVIAVLVLLGNLLADILYAYLDPRIRYGAKA
jgi:peptide/nickel transport system permease protein